MSFNHIVVWLDHQQAHLIQFNREQSERAVVKADSGHRYVEAKGGSGKPAEDIAYLEEVAQSMREATEVLIVGPSMEKLSLLKHLIRHHPQEVDKVVGVETVDHPSDGQLLAYARKYFHRVDQMR